MNNAINQIDLEELKNTFQDCNINFLLGSGMSDPYLDLLGNIESLLSQLDYEKLSQRNRLIIEASLFNRYFNGVIKRNIEVLEGDNGAKEVLSEYISFFKLINTILLNRKSTILSKQVNIFTSNVDVFIEKALEESEFEYNDGFCGRFAPIFSLGNFKKSSFRKSLQYDNTSEIPVFNLIKVHGSLTWDSNGERIIFSSDLKRIRDIKAVNTPDSFVKIEDDSTIKKLVNSAVKLNPYRRKHLLTFLEKYKQLLIVNPTKEKFKDTVFNQAYYDLLRIFSNELEKENTVLVVMGFSFADEHIKELTIRAANSNPTLKVYIISHTSESGEKFLKTINFSTVKNNNIRVIIPDKKNQPDGSSTKLDAFKYNLSEINKRIFSELLKKIEYQNGNNDKKIKQS